MAIAASRFLFISFFFFNDTATTEIYTLSLHDALPIGSPSHSWSSTSLTFFQGIAGASDRKSTRLNSSHMSISYAVFCLKKKKQILSVDRVADDIDDVWPVMSAEQQL